MPTPVGLGQIVQVTPRYLIEDQECENVWYFENVSADTDMLANLLLVIATCIIQHLLPVLAGNVTLTSVRGSIVGPVIGPMDEWTPGAGDIVQGAAAGDAEPSFVSAVVSLHTTRGGRSGRGRIYFGGIPESGTTASRLNVEGPVWTGIINTISCILASFGPSELGSGAKYQWVILSRKLAGVNKPPFPLSATARVQRFQLQQQLGTTRSRKVGHGK